MKRDTIALPACPPPMNGYSTFHSVAGLLDYLRLDMKAAPYTVREESRFPFFVPVSFAGRMRKGDWFDPLLLQVLPRGEEEVEREGFAPDAVHDSAAQVAPGLLHKYASRVLLMVTGACAMHCRYCFRREYPFCDMPVSGSQWEAAWRYIESRGDVHEVVLSGGDPLCAEPELLESHIRRIRAISHVKTVRIHTRAPVADPGRIRGRILDALSSVGKNVTCIVVIHANHAAELTGDCSRILSRLKATGVLLLNQSVLLAGVNDSAGALADLSRALLSQGVLPYYLHQLDRVRGAWHFEVEAERGKSILRELRTLLPGYAVPRYVREAAGERAKQPMC